MLRPSYAELMDVMSENSKEAVTSRYTVVIAAAKRARQLIDGDEPMAEEKVSANKPVSIAVEEIKEGKVIVVPEGQGTIIKPKTSIDEDIKKELEETAAEGKKTEAVIDEDVENIDDIDDLVDLDGIEDDIDDVELLDGVEEEEITEE